VPCDLVGERASLGYRAIVGEEHDDEDRRAILARRSRLIALALGGLATAAPGCYDSHEARDAAVTIDAGEPVPCLGAPLQDAGPTPCLEPPLEDAGPMPCLDFGPDAG
jgi:hypothetical protein